MDSAAEPKGRPDPATAPNVYAPEPAWEHQPVAVLALELKWPGVEGSRHSAMSLRLFLSIETGTI